MLTKEQMIYVPQPPEGLIDFLFSKKNTNVMLCPVVSLLPMQESIAATPLHIFSACSHQVILGALGGKHAVTMFMNALPMLLCSLVACCPNAFSYSVLSCFSSTHTGSDNFSAPPVFSIES